MASICVKCGRATKDLIASSSEAKICVDCVHPTGECGCHCHKDENNEECICVCQIKLKYPNI